MDHGWREDVQPAHMLPGGWFPAATLGLGRHVPFFSRSSFFGDPIEPAQKEPPAHTGRERSADNEQLDWDSRAAQPEFASLTEGVAFSRDICRTVVVSRRSSRVAPRLW